MRFGSLSFLMYLFMLVCYTHVFPYTIIYSVSLGSVRVGLGVATVAVVTRRSGDPGSGPQMVSSGLSPLLTTILLCVCECVCVSE